LQEYSQVIAVATLFVGISTRLWIQRKIVIPTWERSHEQQVDLQSFVRQMGVLDAFREQCPEQPGFTWHQAHHQSAERTDMVLATSIGSTIVHMETRLCVCPDHNNVIVTIVTIKIVSLEALSIGN
jgi:hypothetical protein